MDIPFHQTIIGRQFLDVTMPKLVRELERLNKNLEDRNGGPVRPDPNAPKHDPRRMEYADAIQLILTLRDLAFLDVGPDGEFYNRNKELDAEHLRKVIEVLSSFCPPSRMKNGG